MFSEHFLRKAGEHKRTGPKGALNLSQAKPAPKAAKLKKLEHAGGSQMQWLPDAGRTNFSITSGILETLQFQKHLWHSAIPFQKTA